MCCSIIWTLIIFTIILVDLAVLDNIKTQSNKHIPAKIPGYQIITSYDVQHKSDQVATVVYSAMPRRNKRVHFVPQIFVPPEIYWLEVPYSIFDDPLKYYIIDFPELIELLQWKYVPHCAATLSPTNQRGYDLIPKNICEAMWPHVHIIDGRQSQSSFGLSSLESLPQIFNVKMSNIKSAGFGVFAFKDITAGAVFGPYKGLVTYEEVEHWHMHYTWTVTSKNDSTFNIDGAMQRDANWLRYINTAAFEEEQNLIPMSFGDQIYYFAYKNILQGSELLTWYGEEFAQEINILDETKDHLSGIAPSKTRNLTICKYKTVPGYYKDLFGCRSHGK